MQPKQVAILTDSATCMSPEIAYENDIKVVPLSVVIKGESHHETELDLSEFCQKLPEWEKAGTRPTSSSVSPGEFYQAYHELSQKAENILYIGHSSKLGMSMNASQQAKARVMAELPQTTIQMIDSSAACGAQTLVALEAARAANEGKSLSEVVEIANRIKQKVNLIFLADDLSNLAKGGRAHKAAIWADNKVTNTAVIEMNTSTGGEFVPLARCKTKGQTLKTLFDIVAQKSGGKNLHVVIDRANFAQAEAEELKEKAESQLKCAELYMGKIGPLITLYTRPFAKMFSWWAED